MSINLPDLLPPNDDSVPWQVIIEDKFWYKLYVEHHYWTLWTEAVDDTDEYYNQTLDDYINSEFYSPYVLELKFEAASHGSGVCLRNFSWTPLGGLCLYRDNSTIDTYNYTLYDFVRWIDQYEIEDDQGDYEDKADRNIGPVSTSTLKYADYFGCEGGSSTSYIYTCKRYQPK